MNWDYSGRLQKAQMDVADVAADPGYRIDASKGEALGDAVTLADGVGVTGGGGVDPPFACPATSWFACSIRDCACSSSCW